MNPSQELPQNLRSKYFEALHCMFSTHVYFFVHRLIGLHLLQLYICCQSLIRHALTTSIYYLPAPVAQRLGQGTPHMCSSSLTDTLAYICFSYTSGATAYLGMRSPPLASTCRHLSRMDLARAGSPPPSSAAKSGEFKCSSTCRMRCLKC